MVQQDALATAVNSCLSVVWHIAVQKISTELLQECFGGLFCTALAGAPNNGISSIGRMISASYRNSLTNSSNKKKVLLAVTFVLCFYLTCILSSTSLFCKRTSGIGWQSYPSQHLSIRPSKRPCLTPVLKPCSTSTSFVKYMILGQKIHSSNVFRRYHKLKGLSFSSIPQLCSHITCKP